VWTRVSRGLEATEQTFLRETVAYPEDSVGHLMSRQVATIRESLTVQETIVLLREQGERPRLTDRLFVLDARHVLRGVVPVTALLTAEPTRPVAELVATDAPVFAPTAPASDAVAAFERYDLVSAPVVDDRGKLLGRVTIDAIMDFARAPEIGSSMAAASSTTGHAWRAWSTMMRR
jgi:magnesium transporter